MRMNTPYSTVRVHRVEGSSLLFTTLRADYILKVSWETRTHLTDRQSDIPPQFHGYFQAFPTADHDQGVEPSTPV